MKKDLRFYYDFELKYLRQLGNQFAQTYPQIASKLAIEQSDCKDPHVERLLEGFAFLAGRVHKKIDDQFPEITEALLNAIYPHFLRPIPSFTIVQFDLDQSQVLTTGHFIDRNTRVESRTIAPRTSAASRQPEAQERCKFQTVYPTTLWPINVTFAEWTRPTSIKELQMANVAEVRSAARESAAAVRLRLECFANTPPLPELGIDSLRFYLQGDQILSNKLYELLCCRLKGIVVRDPSGGNQSHFLPASALRPVGLEDDEGALPYPGRSFTAYRLLQEYFAFPQKFFFVEISGLRHIWNPAEGTPFGTQAEFIFLIDLPDRSERLETFHLDVRAETFRLGCTPVINLYEEVARTIKVDPSKHEYPVVPETRHPEAVEIFSIDDVFGKFGRGMDTVHYLPFFAFRYPDSGQPNKAFWIANRKRSGQSIPDKGTARPQDDEGTDVTISLMDPSMDPAYPDIEALDVRLTCTNRDLPSRLTFRIGAEALDLANERDRGDLVLDGQPTVRRTVILTKPTKPQRVLLEEDAHWRLISHLSLNYLSLLEDDGTTLKQMLRIYNFDDAPIREKHLSGITSLKASADFAPVSSQNGPVALARGVAVEIEFDEEQFGGGGTYLFASILERFFGLYASMNSFVRLKATSKQRENPIREWPPRAGQRILV